MDSYNFFDSESILTFKPEMIDKTIQVSTQDVLRSKSKFVRISEKIKELQTLKNRQNNTKKFDLSANLDYRSTQFRNLLTSSHTDVMNNLEKRVFDFLNDSQ